MLIVPGPRRVWVRRQARRQTRVVRECAAEASPAETAGALIEAKETPVRGLAWAGGAAEWLRGSLRRIRLFIVFLRGVEGIGDTRLWCCIAGGKCVTGRVLVAFSVFGVCCAWPAPRGSDAKQDDRRAL